MDHGTGSQSEQASCSGSHSLGAPSPGKSIDLGSWKRDRFQAVHGTPWSVFLLLMGRREQAGILCSSVRLLGLQQVNVQSEYELSVPCVPRQPQFPCVSPSRQLTVFRLWCEHRIE